MRDGGSHFLLPDTTQQDPSRYLGKFVLGGLTSWGLEHGSEGSQGSRGVGQESDRWLPKCELVETTVFRHTDYVLLHTLYESVVSGPQVIIIYDFFTLTIPLL